jgi:hypothetical protein
MTTAFTAIPMKMTMSASRFRGDVMAQPYSPRGAWVIDPDQGRQIFFMTFMEV